MSLSTVEKTVEVNVPVPVAYNQWTQFEEFPRFMEGVEEVRQVSDARLHWRAEIAGIEREWDSEIVEQTPDTRIAWRADGGTGNSGVVEFIPTDLGCKVMVRITYSPADWVEKLGDALGIVGARVQGDLDRFKEYIEARGRETGAWRGEIHQSKIVG
jgi:uncharacterized membrane protein